MIGKILKTMRKVKGYTQKQLSDLIEIPQNTLSQYETGKIEPTYETMRKIAKACDFDIEFKNNEIILTTENIDRKEV